MPENVSHPYCKTEHRCRPTAEGEKPFWVSFDGGKELLAESDPPFESGSRPEHVEPDAAVPPPRTVVEGHSQMGAASNKPKKPRPAKLKSLSREGQSDAKGSWRRKYSNSTVALLFGLSGNRCAHPDCINKVIEDHTNFDSAAVNGHIAHIYSGSKTGPRSYVEAGFDSNLINDFENLLLLCRHHHGMIDNQPGTYTAEQLRSWKEMHLKRNSSIQISMLPESMMVHSIVGFGVQAFTADAKLIQIGHPETQSVPVASGSAQSTVIRTTTPYIFEFDNGFQYSIELTNFRFVCATGNRVSLLMFKTENGDEYPFSIYDHASMSWTVLPKFSAVKLENEKEIKIVGACMSTLALILLGCSWIMPEFFYVVAAGSMLVFGVLASSIQKLRRMLLRRVMQRLQVHVQFG